MTQRFRSFMRAALRRKPAEKHDLSVEVYDTLGRASLKLHATGGNARLLP